MTPIDNAISPGSGLRVLVCGGRDYSNRAELFGVLNGLHRALGIACLIHGAASGADTLADEWADATEDGILVEAYPADWKRYGRAAGPKRNARMLKEGSPDLVVAFEGGKGTRNMIEQACRAGVEVLLAGPWCLQRLPSERQSS